MPPPAPLVAWEPPPPASVPATPDGIGGYDGGRPPFTLGAILSDSFARYGADPIRFFILALAASILSFLGSFLSLPTASGSFGTAADSSGLVGLLSFVVGLVTSSATFALAEGGPSMPVGRVLRRGVERAGWMFLTSLVLGVGFVVVFLLALIPLLLFAFISEELFFVAALVLVPLFIWLGLRFALALPANVVDNLNSIDGLKVSWRITRPSGVWARVFAASLLLVLLVLPLSLGGLAVLFVAIFGAQPLLLLVASVAFAFVTPLSALVTYSAYRRLVPPIQPSWVQPALAPGVSPRVPPAVQPAVPPAVPLEAMPDAPPDVPLATTDAPEPETAAFEAPAPTLAAAAAPVTEPPPPVAPAPVFRVPPFGLGAKAILALVIALDVAGVLAVPYAVNEFVEGRITLPRFPTSPGSPFPGFEGFEGFVVPGTIAFGTSSDFDACTVENQSIVMAGSSPMVWLASFERPVNAGDEVFLRVSHDGDMGRTDLQPAGAYDCLGATVLEVDRVPGVYLYEVVVNGRVEAQGSLFVQ